MRSHWRVLPAITLFLARAAAASPPANDACASAIPVAVGASTSGNNTGGSVDGYASCGNGTGLDVWYSVTPATGMTVGIDATSSAFDVTVSVHSACPGTSANTVACHAESNIGTSRLSFAATGATTYFVRVVGHYAGGVGPFTFAVYQPGTVAGTILDGSNQPIAGIGVGIFDGAGVLQGSATTLGNGTYSVDLPPGTYYARTSNALGYIDRAYNNHDCAPCTVQTTDPITVTATATTTVNFTMVQGASIAGTVLASFGAVETGYVYLNNSAGQLVTSAYVGHFGDYVSASGLPPGNYYATTFNPYGLVNEVWDDIPCASCDPTMGTPIPVAGTATVSGIDFYLDAKGGVAGTVRDAATLAVISGASVTVRDAHNVSVGSTTTNGSGVYYVSGLVPGPHFVQVSKSGYVAEIYDDVVCPGCAAPLIGRPVAVLPANDTLGIDFALSTGGSVSGTVTDAVTSAPLSGVPVQVWSNTGGALSTATTNASGQYTCTGVPPGTHLVRTNAATGNVVNELYDNLPCTSGCDTQSQPGTPVTVVAGATTSGVNFALGSGGTIAGTVSGPSIASVWVFDPAGKRLTIVNTSGGAYTTSPLPAGNYTARTQNSLGYIDVLYSGVACSGCDETTGAAIPVTAGNTTSGINFTLALGGRISGVVSDAATGRRLSNVNVQILTPGGRLVTNNITDSSGRYKSLAGLASGSYLVRSSNGFGYFDELYDDHLCEPNCAPGGGDLVTVTSPSTTTGVNLALASPLGSFYSLSPCRVFDTRLNTPLAAGVVRGEVLTGVCGIPTTAVAISGNLTVVGGTSAGYLTAWQGFPMPRPNTLSVPFAAGQTRAGSGVWGLAPDFSGVLNLQATLPSGTVHVVLDVNGYFQ